MAAVPPSSFKADSSSSAAVDRKLGLLKQIRSHEVAIAELSALSSSRGVYQKNGNLFFRTTIEKALACEQSNKFCIKTMDNERVNRFLLQTPIGFGVYGTLFFAFGTPSTLLIVYF